MKRLLASSILLLLVSFNMSANAMELSGETTTKSKVYKPTKSAVKKALTKMGIKYTVDSDGDLMYNMEGKDNWSIYVIFNESAGELWNLQVLSQFGTKKSRYDELIKYANEWNRDKKYPKLSMVDRDSLRLVSNYPIQYGFNPDEFEDNIIGIFEKALEMIADDTDAMRR